MFKNLQIYDIYFLEEVKKERIWAFLSKHY